MVSLLEEVQTSMYAGVDLMEEGCFGEASEAFEFCLSKLSWCVLSPTPMPPCSSFGCLSSVQAAKGYQRNQILDRLTHNCSTAEPSMFIYSNQEHNMDSQSEYFAAPFQIEHCDDSTNTRSLSCCCQFPSIMQENANDYNGETNQRMEIDDDYCECACYCYLSKEDVQRTIEDTLVMTSSQHISVTICCLFNLALCYHLEWEQRLRSSSRLLRTALSLYEKAFAVSYANVNRISRWSDDTNEVKKPEKRHQHGISFRLYYSPSDTILKVLMAICVNATYCHSELTNDFDQVQFWNQTLNRILQYSHKDDIYSDGIVATRTADGCKVDLAACPCRTFFELHAFLDGLAQTTARTA